MNWDIVYAFLICVYFLERASVAEQEYAALHEKNFNALRPLIVAIFWPITVPAMLWGDKNR